MAGVSLLRSGAPRIGLTRHNEYASLHGDGKRQPDESRKPSPPIYAPPRSSSSEEDSDVLQFPDDGLSDDSEFGGIEPKKKPYTHVALITGTDSGSAKGEDGQKRGLSVEPSNIRAGSFTSGTGSQSGQKRKNADTDDDELPLPFSQRLKRQRQIYGYGSTNKNRASVKKSGTPTQTSSKESDKARHSYKTPMNDATIAIGKLSFSVGLSRVKTADLDQLIDSMRRSKNRKSLGGERLQLHRARRGINELHNARSRARKTRLKARQRVSSSLRDPLLRKYPSSELAQ